MDAMLAAEVAFSIMAWAPGRVALFRRWLIG